MRIYSKISAMVDKAVEYSKKLDISHYDADINIYRLPPSFTQKGIIEHPRQLEGKTYLSIYVRLDDERYITLAHEMIHAKQILEERPIDENEAYIMEKQLANDL